MRHEKLITRDDGTVIRLVANYFANLFGPDSVEFFALVQTPRTNNWELYTPDRTKHLHGMSVDEYMHSNKRGLFSVVSYAEIFKAGDELQAKLRA